MSSRRNFLRILSQLYVLPALSVSALLKACAYNKMEEELPELQLLPLPDLIYEGEPFVLKWHSQNIDWLMLKIITADEVLVYQTSLIANTGSFTVTEVIAGGQYKIHLAHQGDASIFRASNLFTVQPSRKPVLTINPVPRTVYENEVFAVTWSSVNIAEIQFIIVDDLAQVISTTIVAADLQRYTMTIAKAGRYSIRLVAVNDPNLFSESPLFDVIAKQSDLVITSPNGGEVYAIQKSISIKWIAVKSTTVNLYYSTNTGSNWISIATDVDALAGFYVWALPDTSSTTCLVKIEDAQRTTIFDISDAVFQVAARYEIQLNLYPELAAIGGYRVFQSNALGNYTLVRISATEFKAYSHICTHNGCTIALEASKTYRCSCHGSEFDFEGNVTNGPAMRPLDLFAATLNAADNVVVVSR